MIKMVKRKWLTVLVVVFICFGGNVYANELHEEENAESLAKEHANLLKLQNDKLYGRLKR